MLKDYALTTADRLAEYIGKSTLTSVERSVMENIINVVTDYVESYTGKRFQKTAYVELYDGALDERLLLNHYPVISTEEFKLEYRTAGDNTDDFDTFDSEDYHIKYDTGGVYMVGRGKLSRAVNRYRVTYTAGYDFDNATTFLGDTEAGDVEMVAWLLSSELWNKRKGGSDIKSEKIGDYAVTYGGMIGSAIKNSGGAEIGIVQSTLDRYCSFEIESPLTPQESVY